MLAGFLEAARPVFLERAMLTCCTPFDRVSQERRFPEIEWLPYDDRTRADSIGRSDAWLGLGDTPFQAVGGNTWFLDHLCQEATWCRGLGVPMFYLGVGVNEREVAGYPQTRKLLDQAEHLWMRKDSPRWSAPSMRAKSGGWHKKSVRCRGPRHFCMSGCRPPNAPALHYVPLTMLEQGPRACC